MFESMIEELVTLELERAQNEVGYNPFDNVYRYMLSVSGNKFHIQLLGEVVTPNPALTPFLEVMNRFNESDHTDIMVAFTAANMLLDDNDKLRPVTIFDEEMFDALNRVQHP